MSRFYLRPLRTWVRNTKVGLIILGSLTGLVITNCETPTEQDNESELSGMSFTVQDTNGNPLESVGIHFIFDGRYSAEAEYTQTSNNPTLGISSVELISFTATAGEDHIRLDWATSSEVDNLGFEIERSEEGSEYSLLSSYTTNNDLVGYDSTADRHDYDYLDYTVTAGRQYSYKLIDIDSSGNRNASGPVFAIIDIVVALPDEFRLYQNYPNPFNPQTTIPYQLPVNEQVLLQVLNWWNGETVRTLVDAFQLAGYHRVTWAGSNDSGNYMTNNIYTYRMTAGDFTASKQMCLLMLDPEQIRNLNSIPLAMTDADGQAFLDFSVIPLGKTNIRTDENGTELGTFTVPVALDFVFLKTGYQSFVTNVSIDTSIGSSHTITLESN